MSRCVEELSLAEVLADPITWAVMAADSVDPQELKTTLSEARRRLASSVTPWTERVRDCGQNAGSAHPRGGR
jgi:hypothetical protein